MWNWWKMIHSLLKVDLVNKNSSMGNLTFIIVKNKKGQHNTIFQKYTSLFEAHIYRRQCVN